MSAEGAACVSRWLAAMPEGKAYCLVHQGRHFLRGGQGFLFHPDQLGFLQTLIVDEQRVGYWQQKPVSVLELSTQSEWDGYDWISLRQVMLNEAYDLFDMLGYASQIALWARQHRFCGQCGAMTTRTEGQRMLHCNHCGLHHYPKLAPSMIVLVTRGDEILLAHSPRFNAGLYSTLAGYVEPGESVEQCVHREIMEEVGLSVCNLQYLGSQNWPFPNSLMLGFHAQYAAGDIRIQQEEIEDARWFAIDNLPSLPVPRSIARYLIECYVAQRLGRPVPVWQDNRSAARFT